MDMRIRFYVLAFLLICSLQTGAQENQYTFNNLNEQNGLVDNLIFCLLKDSHGILWVGTQNGLSRFDGSHFYSFKRKRDKNSLPHNAIECLCEDKNGNIWGGTDNGIFCYSRSQNKFETYNAPADCYDNAIFDIACDNKGNMFASTAMALMKFNAVKKEFQKVIQFHPDEDSLMYYRVGKNRVMYDKKNDGFWFATGSGLLFYDNARQDLIGYEDMPSNPLFAKCNASAFTCAENGSFWFSNNSTQEVIGFDPATKTIVRKVGLKGRTPQGNIATMLMDSKKRLWISNWAFNLLCIHLNDTDRIEQIYSKDEQKTSVAGQFLWDAMEDENGTIWFGTLNGISICNADKQLFKACHLPDKIPELRSTPIYIMKEHPNDKSWWITTGNHTIIQYFPTTHTYRTYHLDGFRANKEGRRPGSIFSLYFVNGDVLITSFDGAWQLKKGDDTFSPSTLLPTGYDDFVIANFQETDTMYYFSNGTGILAVNKFTKKARRISYDSSQKAGSVNQLLWKPNHPFFWTSVKDFISTEGTDGKPELIPMIKDKVAEAGGYFHAADMDRQGNIWVVNKGVGLYRYNPYSKKVDYWNDLDGLVNNHLHAVLADDSNYVWCTYYNKVSVFNSKDASFSNFSIPYGESKSVYFNTLTKRSDGIIMGNVYNDVFEFYAENLHLRPVTKTPEFSSISISGRDVISASDEMLDLKPSENSIRLKFGLLLDRATYPHTFEFFLEGSDKNWVQASSGNEANYNNLASGDYTFHLIAKGTNNAWQSAEKIIHIHIQTPFYKTKWFLAIILFLITSMIFLLYRYRLLQKEKLMRLETKAQLLEKEKALVMYESLKQQLNPHFLFNSLTSLSGLIEIDQAMAGEFLEQMSGIYRYILKHGDHETVTLKDEITFVTLYINLQQTRFQKGLIVNINVPDEQLYFKIAPVTLLNLIENAMKHNIIDAGSPLVIDIFIEHDYLVVKNNLQRKNMVETSNKKGLAQFATLYKYLSERPILTEETATHFIIKIPLV